MSEARVSAGRSDATCTNVAHPGYTTARDVARLYATTVAYVYKLANRDHWRRYTLDGKVRYHRDDVDASFHGAPELTQVTAG